MMYVEHVVLHSDGLQLCRLPQPCWLVKASHQDHLVYFTDGQTLFVNTFSLSQEEFVGKVNVVGKGLSPGVDLNSRKLVHIQLCILVISALANCFTVVYQAT